MTRLRVIDAKVLQSTHRFSRCLPVSAHNLRVNIDRTPPLTGKGVRSYRCRSTCRRARRLATCRTGTDQVPRELASCPGIHPAGTASRSLRGRHLGGRWRCDREFSPRDSIVARMGGCRACAQRFSLCSPEPRTCGRVPGDHFGGGRRGCEPARAAASVTHHRGDGGRFARHDRRTPVSRD